MIVEVTGSKDQLYGLGVGVGVCLFNLCTAVPSNL